MSAFVVMKKDGIHSIPVMFVWQHLHLWNGVHLSRSDLHFYTDDRASAPMYIFYLASLRGLRLLQSI